MSKIVKRHRVILDDKTFSLAPDIIPNIDEQVLTASGDLDEHIKQDSDEQRQQKLKEDLEKMLDDAAREAKIIEDKAQSEAQMVINDAYESAKGIYEKSKDEGYDDGYQAGMLEAKAQAESIIDEALNIKNIAQEQYAQMIENAETEMIQLVLDTVKLVIDHRVEEDESVIETAIKKGIERCVAQHKVVLKVSTEDYGYAISLKDKILALSENVDEIEIKEEFSFSKGSCVVESSSGNIDSGIYTQYEKVKSLFLQLLDEV